MLSFFLATEGCSGKSIGFALLVHVWWKHAKHFGYQATPLYPLLVMRKSSTACIKCLHYIDMHIHNNINNTIHRTYMQVFKFLTQIVFFSSIHMVKESSGYVYLFTWSALNLQKLKKNPKKKHSKDSHFMFFIRKSIKTKCDKRMINTKFQNKLI